MDVINDNSRRTLNYIGEVYELPQYVKDLEILEKDAADKLDDALFADDVNRNFPLDSAGNVWLSAAYLNENKGQLRKQAAAYVEQRIKLAASVFGTTDDVNSVLSTTKEAYDPESDESNYGWVVDLDGGSKSYRYPMFDERGVKLAMDYFAQNRGNYPLRDRRTIATRIMKKAESIGVEPIPAVQREAGRGYPQREVLMNEILERAHHTKDAESATLLANVNEVIAHAEPAELLKNMDKIAECLDAVDRLEGYNQWYGTRLLTPADTVYSLLEKDAHAAVDSFVTLKRHTFNLEKLAQLDPETYAVLGDDFITEIKNVDGATDKVKLAAILPTLPNTDKTLLEEHLQYVLS